MSIETQLQALLNDRDAIREALIEQGVDEAEDHGFDDFAEDIASIVGGGGAAIAVTETPDSHGGTVLEITSVDLSRDTVKPERLLYGFTAHNASGLPITGTAIQGTDTSDASLSNGGQMLYNVTAYANGSKYTGTIQTKTSSDVTKSNNVVTIPSGYYASQVQTTVGTTKAATTYTPGTSNQTIAAGTYLTGAQTIAGDADLVGSNIISTANIFGVQGTVVIQHYYTGSGAPASSLGANGDIYLRTG